MVEFVEVPHASLFPHACVACAGGAGPLLDTHRELHPYGRVYVCLACIKRLASVSGLAKGDKLDEIAAALERLASVERDFAAVSGYRDDLSKRLTAAVDRIATLEEERAQLVGRNEQLTERLAASAKADLELIGS